MGIRYDQRVKALAVSALHAQRVSKTRVFQHHALHINRDGIELLPNKWYYYRLSNMAAFVLEGPFDTEAEACEDFCGH